MTRIGEIASLYVSRICRTIPFSIFGNSIIFSFFVSFVLVNDDMVSFTFASVIVRYRRSRAPSFSIFKVTKLIISAFLLMISSRSIKRKELFPSLYSEVVEFPPSLFSEVVEFSLSVFVLILLF